MREDELNRVASPALLRAVCLDPCAGPAEHIADNWRSAVNAGAFEHNRRAEMRSVDAEQGSERAQVHSISAGE